MRKSNRPQSRSNDSKFQPDNILAIGGQNILVARVDETGGGAWDSVLYRDKEENFYLEEITTPRSLEDVLAERGEMTFPKDSQLKDRLCGTKRVSIRRVSPQGALTWYLDAFVAHSALKPMLAEAISDYIPRSERLGKSRVVGWVSARERSRLRRVARSESRSESEQLELFVQEGLAVHEIRRAAKRSRGLKRSPLPGQQLIQFQLMTAIVCQTRMLMENNKTPAAKAAAREVLSAVASTVPEVKRSTNRRAA